MNDQVYPSLRPQTLEISDQMKSSPSLQACEPPLGRLTPPRLAPAELRVVVQVLAQQ